MMSSPKLYVLKNLVYLDLLVGQEFGDGRWCDMFLVMGCLNEFSMLKRLNISVQSEVTAVPMGKDYCSSIQYLNSVLLTRVIMFCDQIDWVMGHDSIPALPEAIDEDRLPCSWYGSKGLVVELTQTKV